MSAWILKNTSALLKNIKLSCIICQSFVKYADVGNVPVIALKNDFLVGRRSGFGNAEYDELIAVDKIYNLESFSKMLNRDKNPEYYRSSKDLFSDFYKKTATKI